LTTNRACNHIICCYSINSILSHLARQNKWCFPFIGRSQLKPLAKRRLNMGTHFITDECTNCAACAPICPVEAISEQGDVHKIEMETCTDCGECDDVCPVDAIKWQ
jgi:Fe-S-cluster-containing hydrogenase component 2